ncbi:hypothetical protein HNP38_000942 [Chryseobacterium defluvii]|uniref:Uncharacterized protein n=1 Tax=Chryseobacterium defluvii TaxID=160396 RepID=A0A840KDQ0_9FLAO|nr:hypothetical protein [Chryseobacterium defluvii]MBB4805670.1 hypothetical protein [Chryseobacterium defluvii]
MVGIGGIIRILRKEYLNGILQTFFTIVLGAVVYCWYSFALIFYPYDFFANNLDIPENIKFEKPLEIPYEENKPTPKVDKQDLVLYDYSQPGIYKYDVYLNNIEKGKIYLKVFEVTKNKLLSEKSVKNRTEMFVFNPADTLKRFELKNDFTIYEGDWGDFYGSRIEVWFKPDQLNKPERKLFTKNYIVQGWMR